jgi:hypothetical protein
LSGAVSDPYSIIQAIQLREDEARAAAGLPAAARCDAEWDEPYVIHLSCVLAGGHDGEHLAVYEWASTVEQESTTPLPEPGPGYLAYLVHRFGGR